MKLTTPPFLHSHTGRQHSFRVLLFAAVLTLGLSAAGTAHGAVTLTGSSTFNVSTNDYTYSYSVVNTGPEEIVIVTLPVFSPLGVTGIGAPGGFFLTFDPSQMVVNFMEDGNIVTPQTFAPGTTVGTFSFNSAAAPGTATFLAYDATGTEFSGTAVSPVPEPAGALLSGFAAAAMILRRRRS